MKPSTGTLHKTLWNSGIWWDLVYAILLREAFSSYLTVFDLYMLNCIGIFICLHLKPFYWTIHAGDIPMNVKDLPNLTRQYYRPRSRLNMMTVLLGIKIPMIKMRRSSGRLIFIIRISTLASLYLYIGTVLRKTMMFAVMAWWRHQMETFSALLAICAGNSPVPGEFPSKRPVMRSSYVSLICAWINGWVNNRNAGDLRRNRANYNIIVTVLTCMQFFFVHPGLNIGRMNSLIW